jgi:hypothetical protein
MLFCYSEILVLFDVTITRFDIFCHMTFWKFFKVSCEEVAKLQEAINEMILSKNVMSVYVPLVLIMNIKVK